MKKKLLCFVCILLIGMLAVPAFAAGEVQFTLEPSKTTVAPGEEIAFSVKVSGGMDCSSLGYIPEYDKNVLEMVSGKCTATGTALADFSGSQGGILLYEKPTPAEGEVFRFTMRVKESAEAGTVTVSGDVAARDSKGHLQVKLTGAVLTVEEPGQQTTPTTGEEQSDQPTGGQTDTLVPESTGSAGEQTPKPTDDLQPTGETPDDQPEGTTAETGVEQTPVTPGEQDALQTEPEQGTGWWIWVVVAVVAAGAAVAAVLLIKKKKA